MSVFESAIDIIRAIQPRQVRGSVTAVRGLSVLVRDLPLPVGSLVRFEATGSSTTESQQRGEIIGFDGDQSIIMLLDECHGVAPGTPVLGEQSARTPPVGLSLLGRVINALGEPIDGLPVPTNIAPRSLSPAPVSAMRRRAITEPLPTGVRAIDAMTTIGRGQRIGVFAGPGVGKSTLLATVARNTEADVNVIALVGERGREAREFIENVLGEEGLAKSVVVVATGDESPLRRVRAALTACTIAEHFRDLGRDVLLIMDSLTRFAQAQRQIGLTVGEPPATRGYTPSVFAMLPVLLERAGVIEGGGSITGMYAVLVEGDDMNEPISDAVRGVLDGHLALSRTLAARGHYPAIDVIDSISRVADQVCDATHVAARRGLLKLLAARAEAEELINIGAYAHGSNPDCDVAIALWPEIEAFLQQSNDEPSAYPQVCRSLIELHVHAEQLRQTQASRGGATAIGAPSAV